MSAVPGEKALGGSDFWRLALAPNSQPIDQEESMFKVTKTAMSVIAALAVGGLSAVAAQAAEYEWRWQTSAESGANYYPYQQDYVKNIEKMSGGRIHIDLLPINSIVAYNETLDAVGANIIQGHITGPNYFTGKDPVFALAGDLTAAWESPRDVQMFFEYGGGNEVYRKVLEKYNVYFLGGGAIGGPESIPSRVPIRGTADLKGLKMRLPEGLPQKIFGDFGVAAVNLPASEAFTALERGVIDAADYSMFSTNDKLGFHRFARYPIYPGFHSVPTLEVSINLDVWKSLPDDLKDILLTATRDALRDWPAHMEMNDLAAVAKARAEGVEIVSWSPEEKKKFRTVAQKHWAEFAKQSPAATEMYDAIINFLKSMDRL